MRLGEDEARDSSVGGRERDIGEGRVGREGNGKLDIRIISSLREGKKNGFIKDQQQKLQ